MGDQEIGPSVMKPMAMTTSLASRPKAGSLDAESTLVWLSEAPCDVHHGLP